MTTTPASGAVDLPDAMRRSTAADGKTELFNLPGYPLMVRAVDFNRIHTESEMRRTALLDEMQKATLAAGQATAAQPVAEPADTVVLNAAMRAIQQALELIDAPTGVSMRAVRRVLRCAVIVAEDDGKVAPLPSTAYAALPEYGINTASHAHFRVLGFTADQMRAFADATHTLRASHGQAPAQPDQPIACSYGDNGYACCEGGPCQADVHNDKLAEQQAPATARADSVQEDAARYRWLRRWKGQEHEPPFTVQHEIDGTLWGGDLDAAIDAARKQGGA